MKHFLLITFVIACSSPKSEEGHNTVSKDSIQVDSIAEVSIENNTPYQSLPDTAFLKLENYAEGFAYEMRYATANNFLKEKVYDCADCVIRKEVADALIKANDSLATHGLKIKFFDCYRPLDVQKKMWKIYPDSRYVANPNTSGSIHNRGGAVDITLVTSSGDPVDMGTDFDHFGMESHHAFTNLPNQVLQNRQLLKGIMEYFNFNSIKTEWWHYNYKNSTGYALSNFTVDCAK